VSSKGLCLPNKCSVLSDQILSKESCTFPMRNS
jgi:hypothetical protein